MRPFAVTAAIAGLTLSLLGAPDASQARTRHVRHYASRDACIRHKANTGTAIGAVAGAVVGNVVGGPVGGKLGGTVLGAGAGAVAGHAIAKHRARSRC